MMSPEFSKQDWVSETELREAGLRWPLALLPTTLFQRNSAGQVCLSSSIEALEQALSSNAEPDSSTAKTVQLRPLKASDNKVGQAPAANEHKATHDTVGSTDAIQTDSIADRRHALRILRFLAHAVGSRRQRQLKQALAEPYSAAPDGAHCLAGLRGPVRFLDFDEDGSLLAHAAEDDFIARWDLEERQISSFPWCDPNLFAYGRADEEVALRFVFRGTDTSWTMGFSTPARPEHIEFVPSDEHGPALRFLKAQTAQSGAHHSVSSSADGQWLASLCRDVESPSTEVESPRPPQAQLSATEDKVIQLFAAGAGLRRMTKKSRIRLFRRASEDAQYEALVDLKLRDDIELALLDQTGRQLLTVGHRELALWDLVNLHAAFDRVETGAVPADDSQAANQAHCGAVDNAHGAQDTVEFEAQAAWIDSELHVLVPRAPRWRQRLSGDRQVTAASFSPDGRSIVIGHADGDCAWLRSSHGATLSTLTRPRSAAQRATACTQLKFMANTGLAIAGFANGELALLDLATGATKQSWRLGDQAVTCLAWAGDLSKLAVGCADGDIWIQRAPQTGQRN